MASALILNGKELKDTKIYELNKQITITDTIEFNTLPNTVKYVRLVNGKISGNFTLSQNPQPDDGGIWFNGYKRDYNGSVYVDWFGAKSDYYLEDGTKNLNPTDNTEAFQKAINALGYPIQGWNAQSVKGGGGGVKIDNGDYLIKNTLYVAGGITIDGLNTLSSRIHFEPNTPTDLFIGDPNKETRALLEYNSFECKNITLIGDAVFGNNAGICFNFEKQKNSRLTNVHIYNFTTGIFYGESTYYIENQSVSFRSNFKNIIVGTPDGSGSGPIVFIGGSMTGGTSEAETSSKIQECWVQVFKSSTITFISTSIEHQFGYPTAPDFAMIRGDYNGTGEVGRYALENTYHEGTSYLGEYMPNMMNGGDTKINPLSCNSPLLRIINYNDVNKDTSAYSTSKSSQFYSSLVGNGLDTKLITNKNLSGGVVLLNGNHSFVEDASTQFINGISTFKKEYSVETLNTFPYYLDIPDTDFQKFGGRILTFNVIDKITNGEMIGIQLYINNTLYVFKSTDIPLIDYGNGFIMRKIDTFIPFGSDATNLRAAVKINANAGCVYNLAYISLTYDGCDKIFPSIV